MMARHSNSLWCYNIGIKTSETKQLDGVLFSG